MKFNSKIKGGGYVYTEQTCVIAFGESQVCPNKI